MSNGNEVKYKVGDKKTWKNEVWHFCDAPNHRDRAKWHTHSAADCRTRQRWIERKKAKEAEPEANLGEDADDDIPLDTPPSSDNDNGGQDGASDGVLGDNPSVQALLATCMNLAQDHPLARDAIADALGHLA